MTVTKKDLDTLYATLFIGIQDAEKAKAEITGIFSTEPDGHTWSEQDIYEQIRKILIRYQNSN